MRSRIILISKPAFGWSSECVHVNSGSIPGPTIAAIAAIAIRDLIPGSHSSKSTVVFQRAPLIGFFYGSKTKAPNHPCLYPRIEGVEDVLLHQSSQKDHDRIDNALHRQVQKVQAVTNELLKATDPQEKKENMKKQRPCFNSKLALIDVTLWWTNILPWKSTILMEKPTINGNFQLLC